MTLAKLTDRLALPSPDWSGGRAFWVLLFAVLSIALGLRLYGIDWDQGGLFHPDERAILMRVNDLQAPDLSRPADLLDAEKSPINPGWFNYGSLPIYLLKMVQAGVSPLADLDLFDLRIPGRFISALADTATVALVFLIGVRWFSLKTAALAALLAALAVIHIQLSHFFAVDGIMTLFIVAAVFFSVRVAQSGRRIDSALAGLMFGMGMATKFSVAPLVLAIITAHVIYAFSKPGDSLRAGGAMGIEAARRQWTAYSGLVIAGLVAAAAMLIAQPYMLIDVQTFLSNVGEQSEMVRRIRDYPYTRQYIDTPRYLYQAYQLGTWGLGPAAGLAVWLGLAAGVVAAWRLRRKVDLVILAWVIPYLLITGWFEVKFMRYMLPLTPFMFLYGARFLWWAGGALQKLLPKVKYVALVIPVVVVAATAHYALSFSAMYAGDHPAHQVSQWLSRNAQPGSLVLEEHWEEGIPNVPGLRYERLELYNPDTRTKFETISRQLSDGEFLVLFSNRLSGTIPRLPERYPASTLYYRALFDGSLGYELAYVGDKSVSAFGIGYDEDPYARTGFHPAGYEPPGRASATFSFGWADESFTVYDHPKSFVFRNTGKLEAEEILSRVGYSGGYAPAPARNVGLLYSEEKAQAQQEGGAWTSVAFLRGLPNVLTPVVWLAGLQLMALAVLPLALVIFRPLPDRGYLLAKPLGLLLTASIAWLMVSLGWMGFGFNSVLAAIAVLAALSLFAWWRYRGEAAMFVRRHWRLILLCECLFLVAFLAFLGLRMANPDLWHPYRGGEKPMDFAYLNAVARSTVMPPYDPWFAGGYLNYYYFGQFIVASLIRFTGIIPQVAYNLAVPMLFALTAGAAFSVVYNLAAMTLRSRGAPPGSLRTAVFAGLAAVVLVAVAGNIDGLFQLAERFRDVVIDGAPASGFDYWRSSRMMAPDSGGHEITEFPFFTFLFADLHAHLIAIPFAILAMGIGLAVLVRAGLRRPALETWGALAALGIVIGALRIINTWDYPTALALAGLFVIGGELFRPPAELPGRILPAAAKWVFIAAVGYLFFLPFHQNFELFNSGVIASRTQTPLWRYLAIHSLFVFIMLSWLVYQWRNGIPAFRRALMSRLSRGAPWIALQAAVALLPGCVMAAALVGYSTAAAAFFAAMVFGLIALATTVSHRPEARYVFFAGMVAAFGLLLGAGVDLLTVEGDISRLNTVFKFYLQAWSLMALASAYFVWALATAGWFSLRKLRPLRAVWIALFAVLAVSVLIYPVLGTRARMNDRFNSIGPGIDGTAYMAHATFVDDTGAIDLGSDEAAIEYMQTNVKGSPVIIEGLTGLYRWGNRFTVYTGLPAVVGWDWHQRQQRVDYDFAVTERRAEVDRFYNTAIPQTALDTLDKYNVRYVIVGQLERNIYHEAGLAKFERMAESGLAKFYEDDSVTIYEYEPERHIRTARGPAE